MSDSFLPIEDRNCKRCVNKNCKWLCCGFPQAGKVIFVGRRDISFFPDYEPSILREQKEEEVENLAEDIEIISGKLEVLNPRWEVVDEGEEKRDYVYVGERIRLKVDVRNYPEGGPVKFDVYDLSGDKPFLIKTLTSKNEGGKAEVEWEVEVESGGESKVESQKSKEEKGGLKIGFEGYARSKYSERVEIEVREREASEDRWIIFEEAVKFLEVVGQYERWEPGPAKNRWIYVFGSTDGKTVSRVWEIRTDGNGKFATYELTKDNYTSRPQNETFEDVAFLPSVDTNGKRYTFYAALSEIRLPVRRIFDEKIGIVSDPKKRCVNIDDNQQVARKVDSTGEEHVILINYLRRAEELRKQYDKVLEELEALRRSFAVEEDPAKKREKLNYEFGGLLLQLLAANPDFEKSFDPAGLKKLRYDVQSIDAEKARKTGELSGVANQLCEWLGQPVFSEVCKDYCALITKGNKQPQELYDFENRIGRLFEGLTRTVEGNELLKKLLPKVKTKNEQTWLQEILLLGNDVWAPSGASPSNAETFENIRSISDGLITLMQEAAISGIGTFKPSEMQSILNKVFKTTGESFYCEIVKDSMRLARSGIRPFSKVIFSFSENSFWRFEFPKNVIGKGIATRFLASDGIDNCLAALNGISLAYNIYEAFSKEAKTFEEKSERVKLILDTTTFMLRTFKLIRYNGKLVRIGGGPVALVGAATAAFDTIMCVKQAVKSFLNKDIDAGIWGVIAASGMAMTTAGSAALTATYFAGAAGATGIGIAPAVVIMVIGIIISSGASIKAERSQMELLIQKTQWGLKPEGGAKASSFEVLKKHYIEAISILSSFSASINITNLTLTLQLKRLEAETLITLHSVEFGKASRGSTETAGISGYDMQIVGKDIVLNSLNCIVKKGVDNRHWEINVDLAKVCSGTLGIFWQANRPEFIRVKISVDLLGDGEIILPEKGKMLVAHSYGAETVTAVG